MCDTIRWFSLNFHGVYWMIYSYSIELIKITEFLVILRFKTPHLVSLAVAHVVLPCFTLEPWAPGSPWSWTRCHTRTPGTGQPNEANGPFMAPSTAQSGFSASARRQNEGKTAPPCARAAANRRRRRRKSAPKAGESIAKVENRHVGPLQTSPLGAKEPWHNCAARSRGCQTTEWRPAELWRALAIP